MRYLAFCFFLLVSILQGTSTINKINDSKKDLSAVKSKKNQASRHLEKIAKDIKTAEKDIAYLENKIDILGEDKQKSQKEYEELKIGLKKLKEDFKTTSKELDKKHKAFIFLLSKQFSVIFAMDKAHEPTQKSIISQEVYKAYKEHNNKVLEMLRSDIATLKKRKEDKLYLHNKTKNRINRIVKKRESLTQKKLRKKKLLKNLSSDEEKYNIKFENIVDRQNSLRTTLAKLNILHKKEIKIARKQAEARKKAMRLEKERKRRLRKAKSLAKAKAKKAKDALKKAKTQEDRQKAILAKNEAEKEQKQIYKESRKVRKVNSSYTKSKTYAYRGKKTICPIPGSHIIKKFGTYIDPIYKIKIFNESITLKSPSSNAKVQNVLNGKIVFAGTSSMLGKVVVVMHSGKMHTVYAGLSKIAPNIKVGHNIKKGYVVGRVAQKLIFQATKNSKHINPERLIHI